MFLKTSFNCFYSGSDVITIGDWSLRAEIALITSSRDFFMPSTDWQGICGLAYDDIAVVKWKFHFSLLKSVYR